MTKHMTVKEFRRLGLLQELNRQFLHPIGLALSVNQRIGTDEESFGYILDERDDPEGIVYADSEVDEEFYQRALALENERIAFAKIRLEALGFAIQPARPKI